METFNFGDWVIYDPGYKQENIFIDKKGKENENNEDKMQW